ncbi:hypothetical protein [Streptomyces avermitilis]
MVALDVPGTAIAVDLFKVETTRLTGQASSVLLDAGENIRALSQYLGHNDPGFTLRTYTHLMPSSEGRTRKAVNKMYRASGSADGTQRMVEAA